MSDVNDANGMSDQRMRRLRRLKTVPRWTVIPTLKSQNVAEHSYNVACLALWLARHHVKYCDGSADAALVYAAIIHDEAEALTGDIPSPARHSTLPGKSDAYEAQNGLGVRAFAPDVQTIVKMADMFEALWFVREEQAFGNTTLDPISKDIGTKLAPYLIKFPMVDGQHWSTLTSNFYRMTECDIHPVLEKA